MDGPLAFAVQDVPSEALAFSNKAEAEVKCGQKLDQSPWRPFRFSENVAGRLGVPRGNSRWFPLGLVWAKRHDVSGRRPYLKHTFVQKRASRDLPLSLRANIDLVELTLSAKHIDERLMLIVSEQKAFIIASSANLFKLLLIKTTA
ncbi:hypothetical protein CXF80_02550 [Shewanella sp. Actino-trap-3]|nr:hypothetical protein CXF80_02550 [Shewanella sp. Actino-trap-3]